MNEYARDIGRIEARQDSVDKRQDSADARLNRIEDKVDQILAYVERNKGGFRMLFALGSIAAAMGGAIAEFVHWIHK